MRCSLKYFSSLFGSQVAPQSVCCHLSGLCKKRFSVHCCADRSCPHTFPLSLSCFSWPRSPVDDYLHEFHSLHYHHHPQLCSLQSVDPFGTRADTCHPLPYLHVQLCPQVVLEFFFTTIIIISRLSRDKDQQILLFLLPSTLPLKRQPPPALVCHRLRPPQQ